MWMLYFVLVRVCVHAYLCFIHTVRSSDKFLPKLKSIYAPHYFPPQSRTKFIKFFGRLMQMLRIKYVYHVLRTVRNVKLTESMFSLFRSLSEKMDLIYTESIWNKLQKVNHIMNANWQWATAKPSAHTHTHTNNKCTRSIWCDTDNVTTFNGIIRVYCVQISTNLSMLYY